MIEVRTETRCQDAAGDGSLCGVPNGAANVREIEEGNISCPALD